MLGAINAKRLGQVSIESPLLESCVGISARRPTGRIRRPTRLGPLRFNFSKGGLSSISVGGRGASFNIPIARGGGARTPINTIKLTGRQDEILSLLLNGDTEILISDKLGISLTTVKDHTKVLRSKFGVKSKVELVMRAMRLAVTR